jgi:DNA-binding transcriptional LysR family regulator
MAEEDPLSGVSIFVAAARSGSFTRAAERLGISKSAVGKSIARTERRLGLRLFHRTTRMTRLTIDGEAYFATCAAAIDEVSAAQAALASSNRILSGRIHIDMPVAFGRRTLLPILIDMILPHPELYLTLTFTDATSDLLQDGVDLAIRFGALKDSSHVIARHLVDQERVICAAPSYLHVHGQPRVLADIPAHRCVVGSPKGPPPFWIVRDGAAERKLSPPHAHHVNDAEAMIDAAIGGLGLCQLPLSLVRPHLGDGSLQRVLDHVGPEPVAVHALWPRQAQLSPRVRYVVDGLAAAAAKGLLD